MSLLRKTAICLGLFYVLSHTLWAHSGDLQDLRDFVASEDLAGTEKWLENFMAENQGKQISGQELEELQQIFAQASTDFKNILGQAIPPYISHEQKLHTESWLSSCGQLVRNSGIKLGNGMIYAGLLLAGLSPAAANNNATNFTCICPPFPDYINENDWDNIVRNTRHSYYLDWTTVGLFVLVPAGVGIIACCCSCAGGALSASSK